MKNNLLIAPSILSANFAKLGEEALLMEKSGADWLHVDVMDGHFVPNLTIGPVVVSWLKKHTALPLDVHLMISDPNFYLEPFFQAGAWGITFHVEAVSNPEILIQEIKKRGMKAGLSLKPKTPASRVIPFIKDLDLVLVMTVEPGFGGQRFMSDMLPKIREISSAIKKASSRCYLQVDGGIDNKTAPLAIKEGANVLVSGSYIFGHKNPALAIQSLRIQNSSE